DERQRFKLSPPVYLFPGFVIAADRAQVARIPVVGRRVIGVKLDCSKKFFPRRRHVPIEEVSECSRGVRLGKRRVELDSFSSKRLYLVYRVARALTDIVIGNAVAIREPGIRKRVIGVFFGGGPEKFSSLFYVFG